MVYILTIHGGNGGGRDFMNLVSLRSRELSVIHREVSVIHREVSVLEKCP